MKRLLTGVVAGVLALLLMGGPAYAHFCTNGSRSEKGNEQVAANSRGWLSVDDFLRFAGVCEDGVAYVLAGFEGTEWEDLTIHGRTVMAQGIYRTDVGRVLDDDRGVEHLSDEDFGEVIPLFEGLVAEVYENGICEA
jgi:hypothetical protein